VELEIRRATAEDLPFLVRLACAAYRDVVTIQFGAWDEDEQAARFSAKAARLPFEIAEEAGRPVAAISSTAGADAVVLHELLVLPEYQGRGAGTRLLRREIRRARDLGLPLRLHTLRTSRALELYVRNGFVVVRRDEVFVDLEHPTADGGGVPSRA
jgi:GNAT superfamily N-acetyltransferase